MSNALNNYARFLWNGGIPDNTGDLVELHKRRLISATVLGLLALAVILAGLNIVTGNTKDNWIITIGILCGLTAIFIQAHCDMRLMAARSVLFALWLGPTLALYQYGLDGSITVWLLLSPIFATFLIGRVGGIRWGVAALATLWCFVYLQSANPVQSERELGTLALGVEGSAFILVLLGVTLAFRTFHMGAERRYNRSVARLNDEIKQRTEAQVKAETAEKAARFAEKSARKAERLKSNFLASMSHEFRTPLNGIVGTVELLQQTRSSQEQDPLIEHLAISSRILHNLIGDVLDISRIEANALLLKHEPVNVPQLCRELVDSLQLSAQKKMLRLVLTTEPQEFWINSDSLRLQQTLLNLVENAIKFSDQGEVNIQCRYLEGKLELIVADSGIGMTTEEQEGIFEAYVQGKIESDRVHSGTGLGLAIVKRIVNLLQGDISVTSSPGVGSTFTVSVQAEPAAPQVNASSEGISKTLLAMNILVADDNPTNRLVINKMLKKLGHRVFEAIDGMEAVEMLQANEIELVLMDIQMPRMDGKVATRTIRQLNGKKAAVPIVAVTANAMPGDRQALLDLGMDEYMAKPVKLASLRDMVSRFA